MIESNRMDEEFLRVCPLCKSCIRSFFINLNEKIIMCENTSCEFPFGHEEIQYIKEDNETDCDTYPISVSRHAKGSMTTSTLSNVAWAEIDKMNHVHDSEDSQFEVRNFDEKSCEKVKVINIDEKIANDVKIQKNVQDLKGLTKQLNNIETEPCEIIKNEKWIKNLMSLQSLSGVQLVKQQEIEQLKLGEPVFGSGELKIDIDTNDNMSSIKIEIMNRHDDKVVVDNLKLTKKLQEE